MKTRKERREMLKKENLYVQFLRIQRHFFKDLVQKFKNVKDPRRKGSIVYPPELIFLVLMLKQAAGLKSMRDIDRESTFNSEEVRDNLLNSLGIDFLDELPHYDTINNFLEKLQPEELEKIRIYMIRRLIENKVFQNYRFTEAGKILKSRKKKFWLIAVDATQLHKINQPRSESYVKKDHSNGTKYYCQVLEAKLILGDIVISIASEFIENENANASKQDCELNAFKRLAKKLKKAFKRLEICLLADSLYPSETVFEICEENHWRFLFRYKEGKIKTLTDEAHSGRTAESAVYKENSDEEGQHIFWINKLEYRGYQINWLEAWVEDEKGKETGFIFITDLEITEGNAFKMVKAARSRWKIENQGFKRQKRDLYYIEHQNSFNYNAQKNHYLMVQITDMVMILFEKGTEYFQKTKNSVKEKSSLLLSALRKHNLTIEDFTLLEKRMKIRLIE
jgi:hypothetical protein